jgi:hypothetical protein
MTDHRRPLVVIGSGILALILAVLVVALVLIKVLWAWTIPDLFPGAVAQGLVAGDITWFTALKLAIFVAVLAAITGVRQSSRASG